MSRGRWHRAIVIAAVLMGGLLLAAWYTTPPALLLPATAPAIDIADVENDIADGEAIIDRANGIVPGTEKRIVWQSEPGTRSEFVVVYLHGFSGSRQELAPVPEAVAKRLGANLFETRLSGHGLQSNRLDSVVAEDWVNDGLEALAVASTLGERVVVIGVSTGATLALSLIAHPAFEPVDTLVMVSPNLGFDDPNAGLLTRPLGRVIARLLVGEYREFEPHNEAQARYWTTRYPTDSVVEMMRLVEHADANLDEANVRRAMLIYSSRDQVVSTGKARRGFERLKAGARAEIEFTETDDPAFHVLAGDVLSPASTPAMVETITRFVLGPPAMPPVPPAPEGAR